MRPELVEAGYELERSDAEDEKDMDGGRCRLEHKVSAGGLGVGGMTPRVQVNDDEGFRARRACRSGVAVQERAELIRWALLIQDERDGACVLVRRCCKWGRGGDEGGRKCDVLGGNARGSVCDFRTAFLSSSPPRHASQRYTALAHRSQFLVQFPLPPSRHTGQALSSVSAERCSGWVWMEGPHGQPGSTVCSVLRSVLRSVHWAFEWLAEARRGAAQGLNQKSRETCLGRFSRALSGAAGGSGTASWLGILAGPQPGQQGEAQLKPRRASRVSTCSARVSTRAGRHTPMERCCVRLARTTMRNGAGCESEPR
ncbi:hypothetical protein L1887_55256 [Cichorium endivia]|nr:hypothetical protein L1887_55256 [Cichorium endivia]